MAILGPADLPHVMKVQSDPMKSYVLHKLGHPVTEVELTEDQFETVLRVTGDWIAGYFPREQRLAVFHTQPLKSTYPLPKDGYWVEEVSWDPVTTRLDDIFGAESFLFSIPGGTKLLTTKGPKVCEEVYNDKKIRLVTPFGPRKPLMRWNPKKQKIQIIQTQKDFICCTPNHPINIENRFRMAIEGYPGLRLLNSHDKQPEITNRDRTETDGTWSVATRSGCFYVSAKGNEFYLVH